MSYAARREAAGAKGLLGGIARGLGIFTAPQWMPAIFNQGQQSSALTQGVNRAAGVVPGLRANPQTDVGRRLGNEIMYAGRQLASGQMPYAPAPDRKIGQQAVLGGRPVYWGGKDYGWQQLSGGGTSTTLNTLNAPGVQNRFIQDEDYGVYGGTSPAADRAYASEKARVQQLSEQDPLFKKYQVADLTKAYNSAKSPEEKERIGLQIWAQTNPQLAAKLKPGQTGYQERFEAPGMQMSPQSLYSAQLPTGSMAADASAALSQATGFAGAQPQFDLNTSFNTELNMSGLGGSSAPSFTPGSFPTSGTGIFDPASLNIDETQRKLLIDAYNRRLK